MPYTLHERLFGCSKERGREVWLESHASLKDSGLEMEVVKMEYKLEVIYKDNEVEYSSTYSKADDAMNAFNKIVEAIKQNVAYCIIDEGTDVPTFLKTEDILIVEITRYGDDEEDEDEDE